MVCGRWAGGARDRSGWVVIKGNALLEILVATIVSFSATLALVVSFAAGARRIGLVDRPDARKRHREAVPLIGGVAIFCGSMFGAAIGGLSLGAQRPLVVGAGALLLVGLLDDLREMSARARFAAQIAAALMMSIWAGIALQDFGNLIGFGRLDLAWFSVPITIFCTVGVINALNLSDGIDGLAGSVCLVCLGGLVTVAALRGAMDAAYLMVVIGGAIGGFLVCNLPFRATRRWRSFLGDAGSMSLGFVLAWYLIDFSQGAHRLMAPSTALWLFALPLMDTVFVLVRRVRMGRSPFAAGRDHLHHLFLEAGFSVAATLSCLTLLATSCAAVGILLEWARVAEHWSFVGFMAMCAGYYTVVGIAWRRGRWMGRTLRPQVSP